MIRIFFGSPGSGKTTLATKMLYDVKKCSNVYDYAFSTFKNEGLAPRFDWKDFGKWMFPCYSYIVDDEAGISFNNRRFKDLPPEAIEGFKTHRHYDLDIDFMSQSWDDIDITIRRLATELWHIKAIGPFTLVRLIYKKVDVDDETHDIVDGYYKVKLYKRFLPFSRKSWFLFYRPKYYHLFDTKERKNLPIRYGESKYLLKNYGNSIEKHLLFSYFRRRFFSIFKKKGMMKNG